MQGAVLQGSAKLLPACRAGAEPGGIAASGAGGGDGGEEPYQPHRVVGLRTDDDEVQK